MVGLAPTSLFLWMKKGGDVNLVVFAHTTRSFSANQSTYYRSPAVFFEDAVHLCNVFIKWSMGIVMPEDVNMENCDS